MITHWQFPDKGPWHKLQRAGYHLDALNQAAGDWANVHRNGVRSERDPDTGDLVYYAVIREQPPRQIGLILGDLAHNARSALDLAVCAMLPCAPDDTRTEYPIFKDVGEYREKGKRKIKGLSCQVQQIIERDQPYQVAARGGDPLRDVLWLLHELDRTDKHRELLVTAAVVAPFLVEVNPKSAQYKDCQIEWHRIATRDGDEVLRIPAACQAEADFVPRFSHPILMVIGGPAGGAEIARLAASVYDRVRVKLYELDGFLPGP